MNKLLVDFKILRTDILNSRTKPAGLYHYTMGKKHINPALSKIRTKVTLSWLALAEDDWFPPF